jgi:GPI mannosyltransferase 1 subunit M
MSNTTSTLSLRRITFLGQHAVWIGLIVRLFLAWFLPFVLDGGRLIPGVSYTDIDFFVFTDAAQYIQMGQSPFARHTYRYTPFLAELLAQMPHKEAARYLFCIADAICGWIILDYRRSIRRQQQQPTNNEQGQHVSSSPPSSRKEVDDAWVTLQDGLWWLYNPFAINICTRGSSDSFQVLLPVLLTLRTVTSSENATSSTTSIQWKQPLMAGLWHGIAVHSKLYPVIYSLSFMSYFGTRNERTSQHAITNKSDSFPWTAPGKLSRLILLWTKRLLGPAPLIFFVTFVSTFTGLTFLAVHIYGQVALDEGLLYHFSRVDHRHNYSMFWYWIYLARAAASQSSTTASLSWLGRLLLVPQMVLLVYSSLGIAPYNLAMALFVQTYLFVTHNKVITAQYFSWYLCLLPLCSDSFRLTKRVQIALLGLGASILLWLGSAYCLEMQGMAVHKIVWIMSMVHFCANVNLLGALLSSSRLATTSGASVKGNTKAD